MRRQGTIDSQLSMDDEGGGVVVDKDQEEKTVAKVEAGGVSDWSQDAVPDNHMWVASSSGVEVCYLGQDCVPGASTNTATGPGVRLKCSACKVVTHAGCKEKLQERLKCKTTFIDGVRDYRNHPGVEHHWVNRKQIKGKCKNCNKTFQSKIGGMSCSWCGISYHNIGQCLEAMNNDNECGLGVHCGLIMPPHWILKLPRKGTIQSSIKGIENRPRKDDARETPAAFILKPLPVSNFSPLVVFLNPKSGGNQGAKLLKRFQSLLNPRQVFDLTKGGPKPAIEMFKNVPDVRLLACGGDGTAGWVLSVLDKVGLDNPPPVGVLPLGTGNDLSRSIGWGGGYMDEPLGDILLGIQNADIIRMDRWRLETTPNTDMEPTDHRGVSHPPLDVVNNYFSLGVDAQIALQFHEAREANPEKFNSRVRNKMYYTQAGGLDLVKAKWRKLSEIVSVECDGVDITPKLRQHKVHSVLFLNVPCFGSGTRPWNSAAGKQRLDDGLIEVIGLTTYQLPLLQAGGSGHCITQCKEAKITTTKTIPVQVDGEAVRLNPCTVTLSHLNKARILAKKKTGRKLCQSDYSDVTMNLTIMSSSFNAYKASAGVKDDLKRQSVKIGSLQIDRDKDLRHIRNKINAMLDNNKTLDNKIRPSKDWSFVDIITATNFFRIDKGAESKYYSVDICDGEMFIVDSEDGNNNIGPTVIDSSTNKKKVNKKVEPLEDNNPTFHIPLPVYKHASEGLLEKNTEAVLRAARMGDLAMLSDLYEDGFSLMAIDETAKTALHYGARFGNKDIVKFLLEKAPHSIIDIADNEKGQTAVHKAAAYNRAEICSLLITAGASLLSKDVEGRTARMCALDSGADQSLVSYLENQEHFQIIASEDSETPI